MKEEKTAESVKKKEAKEAKDKRKRISDSSIESEDEDKEGLFGEAADSAKAKARKGSERPVETLPGFPMSPAAIPRQFSRCSPTTKDIKSAHAEKPFKDSARR